MTGGGGWGVGGGMSTFLPEMLRTAILQCFVNIINTQIPHYVGDLAECNIMWCKMLMHILCACSRVCHKMSYNTRIAGTGNTCNSRLTMLACMYIEQSLGGLYPPQFRE